LSGGKIFVTRAHDDSINVVEAAKPSATATNVPGGILFLLHSVTNVVSLLLQSTNQWSGLLQSVSVTNCALHWEDDVNSRPARLDLTDMGMEAKNISNLPGTNLAAALALRWNTNGAIRTTVSASFLPPTAEVRLDLDRVDLGTLDPYLEPKLNLFILGSRLGLHGTIHLATAAGELPQVTFHGDASLDDFHTVDGVLNEDLVKWDSLRFSDIDANLNPQSVAIREIAMDNLYARIVIECAERAARGHERRHQRGRHHQCTRCDQCRSAAAAGVHWHGGDLQFGGEFQRPVHSPECQLGHPGH